jgi:hypothetical protein
MRDPSWRTVATVALLPVAVLAGSVRPDNYLPKHGGIYFAIFTVLLGVVLGYRAVLLVFVGLFVLFIRGQTQWVS